MDAEALKTAVKSDNGDVEKKLAEMTEDQRKELALRCVPELAVGAKVLGGIIIEAYKNGKITDKTADDVAGFVGGLASSVQQVLGFDEKMATHDFSTTFCTVQMMKSLCEGKKE